MSNEHEVLEDQIRDLKKDPNALDQSVGLNRILLTLIDGMKRSDKWKSIVLIISILANVAMASIFLVYESQMITTEDITTVTQDSGDSPGNNVYQAGENAQYVQGEELNDYGPTENTTCEENQNQEE